MTRCSEFPLRRSEGFSRFWKLTLCPGHLPGQHLVHPSESPEWQTSLTFLDLGRTINHGHALPFSVSCRTSFQGWPEATVAPFALDAPDALGALGSDSSLRSCLPRASTASAVAVTADIHGQSNAPWENASASLCAKTPLHL